MAESIPDEAELVRRTRHGDAAAFRELVATVCRFVGCVGSLPIGPGGGCAEDATPLRDPSRVANVEHVLSLSIRRADVSDDDLMALAGMKNLQHLDLSRNPRVTDDGVVALSGLESLRVLDLTSTNVTGMGLKDRADMVAFIS